MAIGETLVIRTDADTLIGSGHLMRCLALAQAWKDAGGKVVFITACHNESLLNRIRLENFTINLISDPCPNSTDWENTKNILSAHPGDWVILDGYHFDESYQKQIKADGHRLLVIDDIAHLKHYYADILLNQNLHAENLSYSCEPHTRLLLGTRYTLLRREFLAWKYWKRDIPELASHILVTLGGGDPENITLKVIKALIDIDVPGLEARVIIGASNPHLDLLKAVIIQNHLPIQLIQNGDNMPGLMAWADIAVSAGGSTVWEMAFMGLPSLIVVTAENQINIGKALARERIAQILGWYNDVNQDNISLELKDLMADKERRLDMSKRGRNLVDGHGAERVRDLIISSMEQLRIFLRPVENRDCELLWQLRNESNTRKWSFNSDYIPYDEHKNWFDQKINSVDTKILVIQDENARDIGQLRFDISPDGSAEVSISVLASERNKGHGSSALELACQFASGKLGINRLIAHIKEGNRSSITAFTRAGFLNDGLKEFNEHKAIKMIWKHSGKKTGVS